MLLFNPGFDVTENMSTHLSKQTHLLSFSCFTCLFHLRAQQFALVIQCIFFMPCQLALIAAYLTHKEQYEADSWEYNTQVISMMMLKRLLWLLHIVLLPSKSGSWGCIQQDKSPAACVNAYDSLETVQWVCIQHREEKTGQAICTLEHMSLPPPFHSGLTPTSIFETTNVMKPKTSWPHTYIGVSEYPKMWDPMAWYSERLVALAEL